MNAARSSQSQFATFRDYPHMPASSSIRITKRGSARRAALAMSLASLCATLSSGCNQLRTTQQFPPPPGIATSTSLPADTINAAPLNASPANTVVAARPSPVAAQQPMHGDTLIVRGQDAGGFVLPPLPDTSADGGRHNRDPLPVSGQRTTVAQTQAQGFGQLPNPNSPADNGGQRQSSPSTPPSISEPLVPPSAVPTPFNAVPPAQSSVPGQSSFGQPAFGQPQVAPGGTGYGLQPGYDVLPEISSENLTFDPTQPVGIPYEPITRTADIFINGYPARTGRIMFGGAVNSDAGITGQITLEERNFDITRWPTSFGDLIGGTAFRGAGQSLRIEAVPGNLFQRYSVNFTEPFLFGYMPISMSLSGFLFDRRFQDWDEERLGGRVNFGYRITPDLSISAGLRGEQVTLTRPRILGVPQLDESLGSNEIYSGQLRLTHDTRNSPFAPSEGHFIEFTYEQAFGDYTFPRFDASFNKYFLVRERADGSGRQTLTTGLGLGFSGEETPIFENYFAGGYTTLRGFRFRGASPTVQGVQVGGRFQMLGTVEYMFPLTADDMLQAVAFVDYGTVEEDVRLDRANFRLVPGFGLRIAVPALGPAPLAFDFGFPVMDAAGDDQQVFSFYMGLTRRM